MPADPAIPAAKVEACAEAIFNRVFIQPRQTWKGCCGGMRSLMESAARDALRAAAAYDAAARLAAGPQPTRERDTDAWWAD